VSHFEAKCTKLDFGLGCAKIPLWECSPDAITGFKGPASTGRERTEREWRSEEGKGKREILSSSKIL